jgi:hypothetical protein
MWIKLKSKLIKNDNFESIYAGTFCYLLEQDLDINYCYIYRNFGLVAIKRLINCHWSKSKVYYISG